jgi:hypothetical protein
LKLNFNTYKFNIKAEQGNTLIFDIVRKKYVRLSPEEWVRQHVIHFLIEEIQVPKGLISVEKELVFNGLKKRYDICVANAKGQLQLLVECKAPGVKLSDATLQQAAIYHHSIGVKAIFISNGLNHYYFTWQENEQKFKLQSEWALYPDWF